MYVIVGLGNPDAKYKNTLHNLGFMAVDLLAEKLGVEFNKKGHKGVYALTTVGGEKVALLKPMTYMNLSGECLQSFLNFYKVPTANVVVLYDDLDIDIGSIRIRKSGSAGTHNGMRNIVQLLGVTDFPRIRIGTKPVDFKGDIIDYVLSNVKKEDEPYYKTAIEKTANACYDFIKGETIDKVMNKYNG